MPRAPGRDLAEIFGFSPDDRSTKSRKQWKTQACPFVGGTCIKHSHPDSAGNFVVYGTCSVLNKTREGIEEVITCANRLYANDYQIFRDVIQDSFPKSKLLTADEYRTKSKKKRLPKNCCVLLGQKSGKEVIVQRKGVVKLSIDWTIAHLASGKLEEIIPVEIQSIDTTGNYRDCWRAYSEERDEIPISKHNMNWANVWKRQIPQLILKGAVANDSKRCTKGLFFITPDRVYDQFEKIIGSKVPKQPKPGPGILSIRTYSLGKPRRAGTHRDLDLIRKLSIKISDFVQSFGSGAEMPSGKTYEIKVEQVLESLSS